MFDKIKSSRFVVALSFFAWGVFSLFKELISYYIGKIFDKVLPNVEVVVFNPYKTTCFDMTILLYIGLGMLIAIFWEYPENWLKKLFRKFQKSYLVRLHIFNVQGFSSDVKNRGYDVSTIKTKTEAPQKKEIIFHYLPNTDKLFNVVFEGVDHIEVISIEKIPNDKKVIVELSAAPTPPYYLTFYTKEQYES